MIGWGPGGRGNSRICTNGDLCSRLAGGGGVGGFGRVALEHLVELVLVDDNARELVRQLLARAEDVVAANEVDHLDPLGHGGHGSLVEAGAEGGGGCGCRVEDAARLRLAGEAGLIFSPTTRIPVQALGGSVHAHFA